MTTSVTTRRSREQQVAGVCFALFGLLSLLVVTGVTGPWDDELVRGAAAARTPALVGVMQVVSWLGNGRAEVPLILVVAGALWLRGRPRAGWRFIVLAASAELLMNLIKVVARRPRPADVVRLSGAGSFSFPSGHSTLAPVIWGFGLVLLAELVRPRAAKLVLWTLAAVMPPVIAVSRVYLGVHYPTDVLAGLALGLGWVLAWRKWMAAPPADGAVRSG